MTNFKFISSFYENIYAISQHEITNKSCTIHINNNQEIQIPLLIAASFSSFISNQLLIDSLMTDFYIEDRFLDSINDEVIQKLLNLLNLKEVQLEDDEIMEFAKLGYVLGNKELVDLFMHFIKKCEQNMNEDTALSLLIKKVSFNIPLEEIKPEISYISSHFSKFADELINLGKDIKYQNVIECIINSENIKLFTEDELLLFIVELCKENNIYESLFEYVWLEYCSIDSITKFIDYINKYICKDNHLKSIIKCINRKLILEPIPNLKRYITELIYEFNQNNPLNGLLRQEYLKNNVEMRASSIGYGDTYSLLDCSDDEDFFTDDEENSWISANLKNKKPFTITKYAIRGNKCNDYINQLQSWKLEGHRISDGQWVELDSHQEEPLTTLSMRSFPIQSTDKYDEVRLIQTGKDTAGCDNLRINAFDIYGTIYLK